MIGTPALGAVVLLAACATDAPVDSPAPSQEGAAAEITFETTLDEPFSGLDRRLREVIQRDERWAQLWDQIHRRVTPRPPPPAVDFSHQMLIAVATGARRTGGFGIAVQRVVVRGDTLEVTVFEACPAPGAMVSMGMTQPVKVVRLEKLPQTPVFREVKSSSCN